MSTEAPMAEQSFPQLDEILTSLDQRLAQLQQHPPPVAIGIDGPWADAARHAESATMWIMQSFAAGHRDSLRRAVPKLERVLARAALLHGKPHDHSPETLYGNIQVARFLAAEGQRRPRAEMLRPTEAADIFQRWQVLGDIVRELVKQPNQTPSELAAKLGKSVSAISNQLAIGRDPDLPGGACLTRDAQRRYQVMSSHPAVVGLRPSEPGTRNNDTIVFGRIEDIRRMAKLINQKPQDEIESDVRFPKISQPDKLLDAENIVSSSNVTEFKKTALAW